MVIEPSADRFTVASFSAAKESSSRRNECGKRGKALVYKVTWPRGTQGHRMEEKRTLGRGGFGPEITFFRYPGGDGRAGFHPFQRAERARQTGGFLQGVAGSRSILPTETDDSRFHHQRRGLGFSILSSRSSLFFFSRRYLMTFLSGRLSSCLFLVFLGCESTFSGDYGGEGPVLHLPVPAGKTLLCSQGVGGSYSHTGTSTFYDIDFDTDNGSDEEVFAPVSGVARVHTESATANFGYHINIDLGDGTYVVTAHLKQIFVTDGSEVAAGTLLGYEGCTGLCTGDHLHIGRHRGDAALTAEKGESIEAFYLLSDATSGESEAKILSGTALVCGISASGDAIDGHRYESSLTVTAWHPDGTLVKTPSSSSVFLLEDGALRWFTDEEAFWSRGYAFSEVTLLSKDEYVCYNRGPDLFGIGLVDAAYDATGQLWLVVGTQEDPDRFRKLVGSEAQEAVLASWGLDFGSDHPPTSYPPSHPYFTSWPVSGGFAEFREGSLMKEDGDSAVYVISHGAAIPIFQWDVYLLLGWFERSIFSVPGQAIATIQGEVGSCSTDLWCLDKEAAAVCGEGIKLGSGGSYEQDAWLDPTPSDSTSVPLSSGCTDKDGDGFCNEATGGSDCWDSNTDVFPGRPEICGDGIDQDCSGTDEMCEDTQTDVDGDGIFDGADDCPFHDNTDQSDADGDGVGDACDADRDGDGTSNGSDCEADNPSVSSCHPVDSPTPTPVNSQDVFDPTPVDLQDLFNPVPISDSSTSETTDDDIQSLSISWTTPFDWESAYVSLSGAYLFANGTYGFTWRELVTTLGESFVDYEIIGSGMGPGDFFRFSIEYIDDLGNTSWSCIGPYPPGILQGTPYAEADGLPLPVEIADDPESDGCGLIVELI
ncbi:MAG TPA: peptidoglycan DD-metalloendopeptidase family protein [Patescibacteria group bacterium]|nr:peptidoglycan DD-metalloendopeptidase family protein [Patescibacteria group bacterium]